MLFASIFPAVAHANPVTGSAGGFSGSGTIVTTPNGDGSGFSFFDTLGNTNFSVNLFFSGGTYSIFLTDSDGVSATLPVTFAVETAPTTQGAPQFHHINTTQDVSFSFSSPTVTPSPPA